MTKNESALMKEKIKSLISLGYSKDQIAEIVNWDYKTLLNYCYRHKLNNVDREFTDGDLEILKKYPSYKASKILHISIKNIEKYRVKYGIFYKRNHNDLYENIIDDYYSGRFSQSEIARKYKVSRQYVSIIVMRLKNEEGCK